MAAADTALVLAMVAATTSTAAIGVSFGIADPPRFDICVRGYHNGHLACGCLARIWWLGQNATWARRWRWNASRNCSSDAGQHLVPPRRCRWLPGDERPVPAAAEAAAAHPRAR